MSGNKHLSPGARAGQADVCTGQPAPGPASRKNGSSSRYSISTEDVLRNWASLGTACDNIARSLVAGSPDNAGFIRISMVLNELLERTVTHVVPSSQVNIQTRRHDNRVAISITGETGKKAWLELKSDFDELHSGDLGSLYRKKLLDSVRTQKVSGLDLVMLRKDFFADISISASESLDDRIWMTIDADVAL